ncbi:MAG: hypothetical protein AAF206_14475 [Bacteroidota bacterium]
MEAKKSRPATPGNPHRLLQDYRRGKLAEDSQEAQKAKELLRNNPTFQQAIEGLDWLEAEGGEDFQQEMAARKQADLLKICNNDAGSGASTSLEDPGTEDGIPEWRKAVNKILLLAF